MERRTMTHSSGGRRFPLTRTAAVAVAVMLVLGTAARGAAQCLAGRVAEVDGLDVRIELLAGGSPALGDPVDLRFRTPDGDELSIGTWQVSELGSGWLWAEVVHSSGRPAVGLDAVICSVGAPSESVPDAPGPLPGPPPELPGAVVPGPRLSPEVAELVADLDGTSTIGRQLAAKLLYRHHRDRPEVQEAVAEALRVGYQRDQGSSRHVDAMAWLTNILGVSGDPRYVPLLDEVARMADSPKLRKYAARNLSRLR